MNMDGQKGFIREQERRDDRDAERDGIATEAERAAEYWRERYNAAAADVRHLRQRAELSEARAQLAEECLTTMSAVLEESEARADLAEARLAALESVSDSPILPVGGGGGRRYASWGDCSLIADSLTALADAIIAAQVQAGGGDQ